MTELDVSLLVASPAPCGALPIARELLRVVAEAHPGELPALVGALAQAQAVALARLTTHGAMDHTHEEVALSAEGVAERLALPPSKVYHLLRLGELRGAKVGKYWRVAPAELASYIRQRTAAR